MSLTDWYIDGKNGTDEPKIDRRYAGFDKGCTFTASNNYLTITDTDIDLSTDVQVGDLIVVCTRDELSFTIDQTWVDGNTPRFNVFKVKTLVDANNVETEIERGNAGWDMSDDRTIPGPYIVFDKDHGTSDSPFANVYWPAVLANTHYRNIHIASGVYGPVACIFTNRPVFTSIYADGVFAHNYIGYGKVIFDASVGEKFGTVAYQGINRANSITNIEFRNFPFHAVDNGGDIDQCVFYRCGYGAYGTTITNCIFSNIKYAAITSLSSVTEVSNNTFYKIDARDAYQGAIGSHNGVWNPIDTCSNLVFRNNIFCHVAGAPYWQRYHINNTKFADFNLYYDIGDDSDIFAVYGNGEPNAIVGEDPLFIDPDNGNFMLQEGSSALAPFGYQRSKIGAKNGGFVTNADTNSSTWQLSTYGGGTTTPDPYIRDGGGGAGHAPDNGVSEIVSGDGWVEETAGKWSLVSGKLRYGGAVGEEHWLLSPVYDLNSKGAVTLSSILQTILNPENMIGKTVPETIEHYRYEIRAQEDGFPQDPTDPQSSGETPRWVNASGGIVRLDISGIAGGSFTVGDTVDNGGAASGDVIEVGTGYLVLDSVSGDFSIGETADNGSGVTADIDDVRGQIAYNEDIKSLLPEVRFLQVRITGTRGK